MQHEKLGTGLIHHVIPQRGLAMQHDEKLGIMKLIMLYHHSYNILILILVQRRAVHYVRAKMFFLFLFL
jgi:hypothetical protein